jgi:hypothetical protein
MAFLGTPLDARSGVVTQAVPPAAWRAPPRENPAVGPRTARAREAARAAEVRDADGRRRFHGAFTGGFSAG